MFLKVSHALEKNVDSAVGSFVLKNMVYVCEGLTYV